MIIDTCVWLTLLEISRPVVLIDRISAVYEDSPFFIYPAAEEGRKIY